VKLNTSLPLLSLCVRNVVLLTSNNDLSERVYVASEIRIGHALLAFVVVRTSGTVVLMTSENLPGAHGTLLYEFGRISVVQMPENHHTRVLRSPNLIELVVIALTQVQEKLSVVEKVTVHLL